MINPYRCSVASEVVRESVGHRVILRDIERSSWLEELSHYFRPSFDIWQPAQYTEVGEDHIVALAMNFQKIVDVRLNEIRPTF